ncbi:MAG TPA: M20/M25/M40 family metallo-hydrolase [Longimicrobium sp.]|jgi:acetylornithine deacetylase/succinyl-diaminopimelate desuccinylase-like protein
MRPKLHAALAAAILAAPLAAQQPASVPDGPRVRQALAFVARTEPQTIEEQIALCEIEAPPFKEARRAADYRQRMQALGLQNIRIDSVGNVIGERPGEPGQPVIVISGHLDTVFPEGTDVRVKREGTLLRGPGIGDDCRGLAVVLAVARAMNDAQIRTRGTVLFVGTVGEEGAGNLRGVRHLFEKELRGRVTHFISVDGTGYTMTKDAVGSHRYRVAYKGPGGHSHGDFGMPNPTHALGRAIARIADFQVPTNPKVTFSVGVVQGGTSVNAIAAEASMLVDMRSESAAALDSLDARFQVAVRQAVEDENARWADTVRLTVEVQSIGIRPAGTQRDDAPIVRAARAAGQRLGFTPESNPSSTDANIPISLGISSLTIDAGGSGQGAHSLAESWDSKGSEKATQWALLLVLALAGVR